MDIDAKSEVNVTALASILGITARRVQQLTQDGTIQTASKGKYELGSAVQEYIEFRAKEKSMSQEETEKQTAEVSIKKAKAIVAVMEAKEIQGKMHRSEDVASFTEDLIYTIRGMLVALPGRLAVDATAASSAAEAAEIIRKDVYKVMEELSNYRYDPKKYEERVRERRRWDSESKHGSDEDE